MNLEFSVSTVAYTGYSMEQTLDSLSSMGIPNVEVALIQGALYDLSDKQFTARYADHLAGLLNERDMQCTSLAAHCDMTLANCNQQLITRLSIAERLGCPRVILYAPRDGSIVDFQKAASPAIRLAETLNIKILTENVGDKKPYVFNDANDFSSFTSQLHSPALGINFDPGNLASHRPNCDLLAQTLQSLSVADHIHIKDVMKQPDALHYSIIGEGICQYPQLFSHAAAAAHIPFFSIEAPFSLTRQYDGSSALKPREALLAITEIERRIRQSIKNIYHYCDLPAPAL